MLIGVLYSYFDWRDQIPNVFMAGILGFMLGLVGVIGWSILLKIFKSPTKLELPEFYVQLVATHIIFGLGTVLSF